MSISISDLIARVNAIKVSLVALLQGYKTVAEENKMLKAEIEAGKTQNVELSQKLADALADDAADDTAIAKAKEDTEAAQKALADYQAQNANLEADRVQLDQLAADLEELSSHLVTQPDETPASDASPEPVVGGVTPANPVGTIGDNVRDTTTTP